MLLPNLKIGVSGRIVQDRSFYYLTLVCIVILFVPHPGAVILIMQKNPVIKSLAIPPITDLLPISVNPNPPEDNPPQMLCGRNYYNSFA